MHLEALSTVVRRIAAAAREAGRDPASICLVAVSKQRSAAEIREVALAGQVDFGESYAQEALPKMDALGDLDLTWHFIGRLQGNKTRPVAERFDWVHTVDRAKIADRLNEHRPPDAPPLNVCIQVQLAAEEQKGGLPPENVEELASHIIEKLPRLKLRGLMCIPPAATSMEAQQRVFGRLADVSRRLGEAGIVVDTLSMGMSDDFEAAIAAGSTLVRVGTAIFGTRLS